MRRRSVDPAAAAAKLRPDQTRVLRMNPAGRTPSGRRATGSRRHQPDSTIMMSAAVAKILTGMMSDWNISRMLSRTWCTPSPLADSAWTRLLIPACARRWVHSGGRVSSRNRAWAHPGLGPASRSKTAWKFVEGTGDQSTHAHAISARSRDQDVECGGGQEHECGCGDPSPRRGGASHRDECSRTLFGADILSRNSAWRPRRTRVDWFGRDGGQRGPARSLPAYCRW